MQFARFAIAVSLILAGCSTQPIPLEQSSPVAARGILASEFARQRPGTCELTIARDPGFMGGGVAMVLYIDKTPVATIKPGEKLTLWLKPGNHTFSTLPKFNLLGATTAREFDYVIKADRRNSIRMGVGQDGPVFVPTSY